MTRRCWQLDGGARFDGRAAIYAAGRPSYPAAAIDYIVASAPPDTRMAADLGAGTGISTRLLAQRFGHVVALDPNLEMALECGTVPSIIGRAERMPLRSAVLGLITAFNSFHWFDPLDGPREIDRVLRPDGVLAVVWNDWDLSDAFTSAFVRLMRSVAGDYPPEDRDAEVAPLYACGVFGTIARRDFLNTHRLDRDRLTTRLQSMSYVPTEGPEAERLASELQDLYETHSDEAGFVEHRYSTCVFIARR